MIESFFPYLDVPLLHDAVTPQTFEVELGACWLTPLVNFNYLLLRSFRLPAHVSFLPPECTSYDVRGLWWEH